MIRADDDYFDFPPWGFGSAHSINDQTEDEDIVSRLHAVVEEINGVAVEVKPKNKIGFY